jgi:hypothetical protein
MTVMDQIPIWAFFFLTAIVAFGCIELGYQWAKHWKTADPKGDAPVGSIVGSTLALLAFMLAFTFGIASSRFDARRLLVVDDANAIGTCYLRAGYIEEPFKTNVQSILKEYVRVRIRARTRAQILDAVSKQSGDLQNKLWAETEALAIKHPNLPAYSLFISSVNDVIDIHAKRIASVVDARVPWSVWLCMFAVGGLAMAGTGYYSGMNGRRNSPESILMVLAFSGVLLIVVDLERPWDGSISAPQTPMFNLAVQLGVS